MFDSRENCNAIIETSTNTLIAGCKSTVIPGSVNSIDALAFYGCHGLNSVTIPNSITSIGKGAFYYCDNLNSVNIGNSVTSIGDEAFAYCENTMEITCLAVVPPTMGSDVFGEVPTTIPVYVPCESVSAYQSASGWDIFDSIMCLENEGIMEMDNELTKIYQYNGQIVVENAFGECVSVHDINGHLLATKEKYFGRIYFDVPTSGVYLIKIGSHPARKVVVIR